MHIEKNLQRLRKRKGLSQEQLAEQLSISRQAISKWESGQSYPDLDNLVALSKIYNVSVDELLKTEIDLSKEESEGSEYTINKETAQNELFLSVKKHFEYKSKKSLKGIPLIHINFGAGDYKAKGIIAFGNSAVGFISVGFVSIGILSFGLLSVGFLSFAALSVGLLAAFGGAAVSLLLAAGGVAIGAFAFGGLAVGYVAVGGLAVGEYILEGAHANQINRLHQLVYGWLSS